MNHTAWNESKLLRAERDLRAAGWTEGMAAEHRSLAQLGALVVEAIKDMGDPLTHYPARSEAAVWAFRDGIAHQARSLGLLGEEAPRG